MAPKDERSLGELLSELSRETSVLVRKEVELATTEITAKARTAGAHVAVIAAGGALAHAALLVLLAAIVIGLTQLGLAAWLAAGIVAMVVAVVGYILIQIGVSRLRATRVVPVHTVQSLKEDAKWTTRQGA
ncbi:MAG TPA: phage holin family protein [Vicinamibacterales bacterium]|jgi:drug/metabolite transporter (DMT)-like permease|nr:phage holin family protein [Vicinamibacterales bacterium]